MKILVFQAVNAPGLITAWSQWLRNSDWASLNAERTLVGNRKVGPDKAQGHAERPMVLRLLPSVLSKPPCVRVKSPPGPYHTWKCWNWRVAGLGEPP